MSGLGPYPFPRPSANISVAYTNPYGCSMAPCTYCGFCERFGCANYLLGIAADLRLAGAGATADLSRGAHRSAK